MNLIQQTLIRQSWQAGRVYFQALFVIWIALGLCMILFSGHQYIGIVFGLAALIGGALFGGYPVVTGTEEFLMGLPPTRTQQFRVRYLMGLLPILVLSVASLFMMQLNLPQRFWGLFFTSGYTTFYKVPDISAFWPLCITIPLCLYACTFVFSSLCHQIAKVGLATMAGWILPASVVGLGVYLDGFAARPQTQGIITVLLTCILFVVISILGDRLYANKEAALGSSGELTNRPNLAFALVGLVIAVIFIVFLSLIP